MSNYGKPLIGVISCNREVEGEAAYIVKTRYVDAITRYANALPVICPSIDEVDNARALVERLDAILLTGSNSNIEPSRYGANAGAGPFDPKRDAMSFALIAAARELGKPVFGVCRGLQEINVALGGTLRDERTANTGTLVHHAPPDASLDDMFDHGHLARPQTGSQFAAVAGEEPITINSVHYQCIDVLAPELEANVLSEDGVVEAVSNRDGSPILAVQWHPEWCTAGRTHDLAFWAAVGEIARNGSF
ncbi:gamma-glutamyl-gamma-aminobutyrate hydrolase family protein [Devosia sp. MC521]|uniref:gamma-glutamyl-gamma-aminobutyrate hydrolase family protein n=1 Tax=Devosia sp. MC521 TaxID=2759954 RepID=UPI0015FA5C4F|nr:gamma-glutamyl-gamma-aminobutyrate hydrolase family protein [Devosia sp. MC521]MBJ6987776.1 gamma-glutamyl-gamma-aminobutyrate hydrolase family protein [Devosia sp. MC521]QMW63686.1 gamma-glutamyl-gamma-aminobutyrate hydrolase family protein [Devosia sp. MC521]